MHIPFPPLAMLPKAWTWLRKRLFLSTYELSHSSWSSRHALGALWSDVYGYFEYSLYLPLITDPEGQRTTKIAIRSSKRAIKRLLIVVEAFTNACRFQQSIDLYDVGPTPLIVTLSCIPHEDVQHLDANQEVIRFTWDKYYLDVKELTFDDNSKARPFRTMTSVLTHTWLLNSDWEYLDGYYYNIDEIKFAKRDIREHWLFVFGRRLQKWGPRDYRIGLSERVLMYIVMPVALIMASKPCIWLQFWLSIWCGKITFDQNGRFVHKRDRRTDAQAARA